MPDRLTEIEARLNDKACTRCGASKPLSEFHADKRSSDGKRQACKVCHRISVRAWRASNPDKVRAINSVGRRGQSKVADYQRKYRTDHPDRILAKQRRYRAEDRRKDNARRRVHRWVARGAMRKPECCQKCGASARQIEASHNDYSKPLEVEWLCVLCHRRKDAANARS